MATDVARHAFADEASADLTALGKRLEILRIQRGLSKQGLARTAGTSRQQLWRVMTGKSELTTTLRQRLAGALGVEGMMIVATAPDYFAPVSQIYSSALAPSLTIDDYLEDARHLAITLRSLPDGDAGRRIKRALLNSLEDLAAETGRTLPPDFSETRRGVLAGEP